MEGLPRRDAGESASFPRCRGLRSSPAAWAGSNRSSAAIVSHVRIRLLGKLFREASFFIFGSYPDSVRYESGFLFLVFFRFPLIRCTAWGAAIALSVSTCVIRFESQPESGFRVLRPILHASISLVAGVRGAFPLGSDSIHRKSFRKKEGSVD